MKPNPLSFVSELMPLSEATAACFHILSHGRTRRMRQEEVERARSDIANSLASLVPVYFDGDGASHPLPAEGLRRRLEPSQRREDGMDHLYIRRSDLVAAIEKLLGGRD